MIKGDKLDGENRTIIGNNFSFSFNLVQFSLVLILVLNCHDKWKS
jgi:hypothetical protein